MSEEDIDRLPEVAGIWRMDLDVIIENAIKLYDKRLEIRMLLASFMASGSCCGRFAAWRSL